MAKRDSNDMASSSTRDFQVGPLLEKGASSSETSPYEPPSTANLTIPPSRTSALSLTFWILLNVLATIGIVFTNKRFLTSPLLRRTQLLFAAYHFLITHLTLHLVSSPSLLRSPIFPRASPTLLSLLPISTAMALNVLLPNLSLALSTVTFYQTARVLLTPCTALLNYVLYRKTLSRASVLALVPVCLGVALVTYADVKPGSATRQGMLGHSRPAAVREGTSMLGATCALLGVVASSVYTLFIAAYQTKLNLSAVQLLHRQSLLGAALLGYFVPWADRLPPVEAVTGMHWGLILVSGLCAVAINLSQFVIVRDAGPVGSTVVGHAKTVGVVGLGWWMQGRGWKEGGALGVVVAVGGMMMWTMTEMRERKRREVGS